MAASKAARARPTAWAQMCSRVRLKNAMSSLNPRPSAPTRFSAGMRTSLKDTSAVSEARMPILPRILVAWYPGVSVGTRKKLWRPWRDGVFRVGQAEDEENIGQVAVGGEHLGAVDDPLAAVLDRRGGRAGHVAAGIRFGDGGAHDGLSRHQAGQQGGLLGLAAVDLEQFGAEGGGQHLHGASPDRPPRTPR